MVKSKVSVGVTSAAGYGVTLAAVVAAALDYIGGDHSQPTKTTLALGIVAGVSFVTTQVGRYLQAHALVRVAPGVMEQERWAAHWAAHWQPTKTTLAEEPDAEEPDVHMVAGTGTGDLGAINSKNELVYWDKVPENPPTLPASSERVWEMTTAGHVPGDERGEDAPPQAALYPLTDPADIEPDEGDARAEGSA